MSTIAILAAYNLETSIFDIVKATKKYVDIVIVVSDGSRDDTHLNAKLAGAECPAHSFTRGKGFAIRKGLAYSKKFDPKYIVLMDADGQHLPSEIPILLAPLQNDRTDIVVGSRMKGEIKTSLINKFGNLCLILISFFVTGKYFSDTESGFRAFKSETIYNLHLSSIYYEIESELLLKALHKGYKIIEVPITVPKAVRGITILDGIKNGIYKIKIGISLKFIKNSK